MSLSLIAPVYAEILAIRQQLIPVNDYGDALSVLLNPAVTPASFAAWILGYNNLTKFQFLVASDDFDVLVNNATAMAAIAGSSAAMTILVADSAAMALIVASSVATTAVASSTTAMTLVVENSTAMALVAASSTAMTAVLSTSVARIAVYDSDTAWDAIAASATAKAALLTGSTEHSTTSTAYTYPSGISSGVRAVLVQQKAVNYYSYAGASAPTYTLYNSAYVDRYARVTGLSHKSSQSSGISYIRYFIMQ